jgi:hypothetical protein
VKAVLAKACLRGLLVSVADKDGLAAWHRQAVLRRSHMLVSTVIGLWYCSNRWCGYARRQLPDKPSTGLVLENLLKNALGFGFCSKCYGNNLVFRA